VTGLKPTYGRVSRYGLVAFASSTDQIGPLARNVRDAALALSVIAGHDPLDSTSADRPAEPFGDLRELLEHIEDGIAGRRVGVFREVAARLTGEVADDWRASLARLEAAGAEIVEVSVPSVELAIAIYYVIATSEASANLARFDGVRYGHRSAGADDLAAVYVKSRSEGFGPEVKRRIMLGTFALSSGYYEAYYGRANAVRERMRRELAAAFESADVIAMPTAPGPAFRLGEKTGDPLSMYLSDIFTTPASLAGLPAVAVPSGLSSTGLPLSLQFMGRPFAETGVFRAARAFEQQVAWSATPSFRGAGAEVESSG
jgi:aspartyl-tRNA(Asn)/glutamyl-tRNA(Gln) amidotransferase subunit A